MDCYNDAVDCYIGLGSNIGDLGGNLRAGLDALRAADLVPQALSSVWETEPVDSPAPLWFWNMAAMVRTELQPLELLERLLEIERRQGRVRRERNEPRTLDLDLLTMGDLVLEHECLLLPHPRMWERRFVLEPLCEIASDLRNPRTGMTAREYLSGITDGYEVRRLGDLATCHRHPL
jgi:2-amino-4-hydroxy-6-hydroxymethyldihydropteridine diphosphokinase